MSERLWGWALVLIGAVMARDGWRLWRDERGDGMFDVLGPDRYIILMGGLLMLSGLIIALSKPAYAVAGGEEEERGSHRVPFVFVALLAVYALITPLLGYTGATFLFFLAAYYLAGRRKLVPTLLTSAFSAACFYVLFPYFADMPLPRGILGF
jgi:hypothetical protein